VSAAEERALALAESTDDALLCVVGPTASGKTELAVSLAERLGGEIVSADSVQIYRYFDIGSGKPSPEETARAPHHLVSVVDPLEPISAADFSDKAERAIADVRARGKRPIVCGGTFFWIRALVYGLVPAPRASEAVRAQHRAIVGEKGRAALHAELSRVDPASAARLHPNDVLRVSRALEVLETSGRKMSELQAEHGFRERRHTARLMGVCPAPELLTERIRARAARWLEQGWIDEVRDLLARGYGDARAMGSVGYADVRAHVQGELSRDDLLEAIVRSTRLFTRRQRTWLKSAEVTWL
jgi:tRNA dimethylallyltransferase